MSVEFIGRINIKHI